jgi:hypothetical protein
MNLVKKKLLHICHGIGKVFCKKVLLFKIFLFFVRDSKSILDENIIEI